MSFKKAWRRYVAAVFCLVMFSMLVPLFFVLGLYKGFPAGYVDDDAHSTLTNDSWVVKEFKHDEAQFQGEKNFSKHLDHILNKLGSEPSKVSVRSADVSTPIARSDGNPKEKNLKDAYDFSDTTHENLDKLLNRHPIPAGFSEKPVSSALPRSRTKKKKEEAEHKDSGKNSTLGSQSDDIDKTCEFDLGSYCNWSNDRKRETADAMVRQLKNQLFLARAYYPSIVRHRNREKLQRELRKHIQDIERMLSEATADADLPASARKKPKIMEEVLAKAKDYPVDCNNVVKKLAQILDLTEDEARFHRKQSVFLYQLAVQTMPKSLHCVSMRLTVEYFRTHHGNIEVPTSEKVESVDLYHYVVFSTNILASSVVVNSTIFHAKEPEKHVFHLITDKENYVAMKFWFHKNNHRNATIHVQCLDNLNLPNFSKPLAMLSPEEFRVAVEMTDEAASGSVNTVKKMRYLSTFNHPHFWLPEIFPKLHKVILLDDDVVVRRDLAALWSINLQGKVNGAVEVCDIKFHHLRKYLNNSRYFTRDFDGNACAWMTGLNIIDLQQWRRQDLTKVYYNWLRSGGYHTTPRFGTLPASLITFYNMTYPLDNSWFMFGLGHTFGINQQDLKKAAILHYNGNLKPWLEIGIKPYKSYWSRYLKKGDQFMLECNVNG